jgi:hypothetical protein
MQLTELINTYLKTSPKPEKNQTSSTPSPRKKNNPAATRKHFSADFETLSGGVKATRVWSWGIVEIGKDSLDDVEWGLDLDSFMEHVSHENANIWFHNLGFDGSFILDWLFVNGYKYVDYDIDLAPKTFKTIIDKFTKFYSVTVKFETGFTAEFRDSYKKLSMPVRDIAKAYGLDISKGDMDYLKTREIGYIPDEDELNYLKRDVLIVAQAMKILLDNGMTRLTAPSDALAEYKSMIGKKFEEWFPILHLDWDSDMRQCYRGGFTYASDRFKKKFTGPGFTLDYNSMYPSVMLSELLPYGKPIWCPETPEPTEEYPLTICHYMISGKLKPNHIPCVQITLDNGFKMVTYEKEFECEEMWLTNIDFELIQEQYDIEIIMDNGGYKFEAQRGMFDTFINKWSKVKKESTGGKRALAKLMLNSLYGKFGSNPNVTPKIPYYDDEEKQVKFKLGPKEISEPVYTAMAVFITSYARSIMVRSAQSNYDIFVYCDTDSQHLISNTEPVFYSKLEDKLSYVLLDDNKSIQMNVHPTEFNNWKWEYNFINAMFVRAKCYMEQVEINNNHYDCDDPETCPFKHNFRTAIAGLNTVIAATLDFDAFYHGNVIPGKLASKRISGGVTLSETTFTINMEEFVLG